MGALGDYLLEIAKDNLGKDCGVRADTFGYLQRSFPGFVSEVDAQEARRVGELAVHYSMEQSSGSVAMRRKAGDRYEIEYFLTPLDTSRG